MVSRPQQETWYCDGRSPIFSSRQYCDGWSPDSSSVPSIMQHGLQILACHIRQWKVVSRSQLKTNFCKIQYQNLSWRACNRDRYSPGFILVISYMQSRSSVDWNWLSSTTQIFSVYKFMLHFFFGEPCPQNHFPCSYGRLPAQKLEAPISAADSGHDRLFRNHNQRQKKSFKDTFSAEDQKMVTWIPLKKLTSQYHDRLCPQIGLKTCIATVFREGSRSIRHSAVKIAARS